MNLGRWYSARFVQKARRTWSASAVSEQRFLAQLDLDEVQHAVRQGEWETARQAAAQHFRDRARPAFCFDPLQIKTLAASMDRASQVRTIARADEITRLTFQFRGQAPVTFAEAVDWSYRPDNNQDWTWELNRHAYFVTLGRAYAYTGHEIYWSTFRHLMLDWLERNPPNLKAANWSSVFEVGYRINVWLWAYHLFLPVLDETTLLAYLRGVWLHGRYLAANLEYQSRNNHLLLECKALALCGLLFPEFLAAQGWLKHGLSQLWTESRQQVRSDGVHGEQAPMYHQVITSEVLEVLVLLENNALAVPADIRATFARMLEIERAITKPNGEIPLLGDSALADSYIRFAALPGGAAFLNRPELTSAPLDEATWWLIGPQRASRLSQRAAPVPAESQAFPSSGYFVMRHGEDLRATYAVFDCGPFGHLPAPGHGHADALSFELYARGQTLIADPGVYSYHLGAGWRNYFRSTAAHTTVTVDGLDQSVLVGDWQVVRPARTSVHHWLTSSQLDFVDGAHDGYERLPQPITHRRQLVFIKSDYWVLCDQLTGQGEHCFDWYFHLAPGAEVSVEPALGAVRAVHGMDAALFICPVDSDSSTVSVKSGEPDPIQGWASRFSGKMEPAPVVCYSRAGLTPAYFDVVLFPYTPSAPFTLQVTPVKVRSDDGPPVTAGDISSLRIESAAWVDYVVLDRRVRPGLKSFGPFSSDGRLIYVRQSLGREPLLKAVVYQGQAFCVGQSPLALRAEGPVCLADTLEPLAEA